MSTKQAVTSFLIGKQSEWDSSVKCIKENAPRVVLELPKAKQDYDYCETMVKTIIDQMAQKKKELKDYLISFYKQQEQNIDSVNSLDASIVGLEKEVEESRVLNELRKEQAFTLQKRTEGNLHSSWMGLWKPLSDEFRVGLAIASIGFILIAGVILLFMVFEGHISLEFISRFMNRTKTIPGII